MQISIKNISKEYKGRFVLSGASLSIEAGDFVAIMGKSGSGKSTLLQLIGGLDKPTAGEVLVAGKDISKLSDAKLSLLRNRFFGFVFQSFYLQPYLTVRQNISAACFPQKLSDEEISKRVDEVAEIVGLTNRLDAQAKTLSGGEAQRVAIARTVATKPQVLLADEPTGNLDSKNSERIVQLLEKINQDGTTVIIVTHDQDIAKRAKRTIKLVDGEIDA
ncbi:ABC transporter ATP-binding protein [Candidatus Saccharibacteria bacterium]|nr:ABC transporter ATP-binding protein [Candidatus Saccharibacteria bacterium]